MYSLNFKVKPIYRLGLNRAASKPRTNTCSKYADKWVIGWPDGQKNIERTFSRLHEHLAALERCHRINNKMNLQEDAAELEEGDFPNFLPLQRLQPRAPQSLSPNCE